MLQVITQHRLSFLSVSLQVPSKLRLAALLGILRSSCRPGQPGKAVVFMSSCDSVEFHYMLLTTLADELVEEGQLLLACPVFMLHGNMPQVMLPGCCGCCMSSPVGAALVEKPALAPLSAGCATVLSVPLRGWGQTALAFKAS